MLFSRFRESVYIGKNEVPSVCLSQFVEGKVSFVKNPRCQVCGEVLDTKISLRRRANARADVIFVILFRDSYPRRPKGS